jgi:hypothetical protein
MRQTTRTLLTSAALLAFAGAVGLYAYRGVYRADRDETDRKERNERLFAPDPSAEASPDAGLPKSEFTRLTITFQGATTTLERKPHEPWRIVSPVSAKADRLVVDAIKSQLETSRFKATLEDAPDAAALDRYGLTHPSFVLEATAEIDDTHQTRRLKIEGGIENTFDGSTYVRRDGAPQVYTVPGAVRSALAKSTFDLRDKQILAVDEARLQRMVIQSQSNSWILERDLAGHWTISRPFAELADATQISSMLSSQGAERAQAFPESSAALTKALATPALDEVFTTKDGKETRIRIARMAGDADVRWYALREDPEGSVLAEVGPGASMHVDRNPIDLKDKALLHFDKELVTRIVLSQGEDRLTLTKASVDASAETWRVASPRSGKARVFKVTSLLWTLGSLRSTGWGEEKPRDWAKYGIDARARTIALFGTDGAELGRLAIGSPVKGKGPMTFYVRGQKNRVAECDGSRFGEFPFALADVLDEPLDAGVSSVRSDGGG